MLTLTLTLNAIDESVPERTYAFGPSDAMDRLILLTAIDCDHLSRASQNDRLRHLTLSAIRTPMSMMAERTERDLQSMRDPEQRETALRLRRDVLALTERGGVLLSASLA